VPGVEVYVWRPSQLGEIARVLGSNEEAKRKVERDLFYGDWRFK
jgi:hypothetical protein